MNIQDSPKQIALTSDQLTGIKNKYNEMVSQNTMAPTAEVVKSEPVVPTVEPISAPVEPTPAPVAEPVNAEPVAPESVSPNIFDQPQDIGNIFDAPQAEQPIVPDAPVAPEQPVSTPEEPTNAEAIANIFDAAPEPIAPTVEPIGGPVEPTPAAEVSNEIKNVSYEERLAKIEEEIDEIMYENIMRNETLIDLLEEAKMLRKELGKQKLTTNQDTSNLFDNPENTMHM